MITKMCNNDVTSVLRSDLLNIFVVIISVEIKIFCDLDIVDIFFKDKNIAAML